jgi:hypothetical protein
VIYSFDHPLGTSHIYTFFREGVVPVDTVMMLAQYLAGLAAWALCASALVLPETDTNATASDSIPHAISKNPRMEVIKGLYAWSGFVYDIDVSNVYAFLPLR